jgi:hypothetical protein
VAIVLVPATLIVSIKLDHITLSKLAGR